MTIVITVYLFILGLACGSFFNVIGIRVPEGQSVVHPPSRCPSCRSRLRAADLLPVLSYVKSGGKCRYCSASVSFLYPFGELATGLLFVWCYLHFGFGPDGMIALLLVSLSVIATIADLKYMRIPDRVLLVFLPIIAGARFAFPGNQPLWHFALGAAVGGGFLTLVALLSRGGMGMGDAKLFALCGLLVGFPLVLPALLVACLLGALTGGALLLLKRTTRKQPIPFGPFLALGTIVSLGYGTDLIQGYLSIFV